MTFHVGQKVVCIHGDWSPAYYRPCTMHLPGKDKIYVVRDILMWKFYSDGRAKGLLLEEIKNPVVRWSDNQFGEHPFWIGNFRPLIERKTDISIFKKMETPRVREREDVRT